MKRRFPFFILAAALAVAVAACDKKPGTDGGEPEPPTMEEETLTADPAGQDKLTFTIEAEGDWIIEPDEDYEWIDVSPTSGKDEEDIIFKVDPNETDGERSAVFLVTAGEYPIYEIMVVQANQESNVNATDLEFLQAIVEGNMLGEDTPVVDSWFNVDEVFRGINMMDKDGKLFIESIDGALLTDFPTKMHLPELVTISIRAQAGLAGKRLPADWSTPKLVILNVSMTGMVGVIPDGVGQTPVLRDIYIDGCQFYGALPHEWTSTALECIMITNNTAGQASGSNAGLGYMIPAGLDVKFNAVTETVNPDTGNITYSHNNPSRDWTMVKIGGVNEGNFIGFEKGYGQARYERYDPAAVKDDITTWSNFRTDLTADHSPWFMTNLNDENIPKELLDWDQAAADAYTAECETALATQ